MQMHPDIVEDPLDTIRESPEGRLWIRVMRSTGLALRRSIRTLKAIDLDQVKHDARKVGRASKLEGVAKANRRLYLVRRDLTRYRSARDYFLGSGSGSTFADIMPRLGYDVPSIRSGIRAMLEAEDVLDLADDLEQLTAVRFRAAA